jgi:type II secretory ATPase GspE/PulE/Tfp pilus assembly ATPase PilB-like protein
MIGEIRDEETARVAVQAALTGHLVLATLHTNDSAGAISRLQDMGIESYLLSGAVVGVVAQRLARTICPHCITNYFPSAAEMELAGLVGMEGRPFKKGEGCPKCHDTGFRGRVGIYEVLEVTPAVRRLIHNGAPAHEIRDCLKRSGVTSLREEGIQLAMSHKTALDEILRVTHNDDEPPLESDKPKEKAA